MGVADDAEPVGQQGLAGETGDEQGPEGPSGSNVRTEKTWRCRF